MRSEKTPEYRCPRLCYHDKTGRCQCDFYDPEREGDWGCEGAIRLPPVKELLSEKERESQEKRVKELREIRKDKAVLALGAGVSMAMGVPGWVGLLSRMAGYAFRYERYIEGADDSKQPRWAELENALISGKLQVLGRANVLEAAQYVSNILKKRGPVTKDKEDELLKGIILEIISKGTSPGDFRANKGPERKCPPQLRTEAVRWQGTEDPAAPEAWKTAVKQLAQRNSLVAVAYLLQAKRGFRRALTYNYDSLVQEYLVDLFGIPEERIVTHVDGWTSDLDEVKDPIELMHVHGYLGRPNKRKESTAFSRESRRVILSEDSYYSMERDSAYGWTSSVQSYLFHHDTCVFVGFSAEDYNFRRILRQMGKNAPGAVKKRPRHYLILTIDDLAKEAYAGVCRYRLKGRMTPEELREDAELLLSKELAMKAAYWEEYGFYPIWATKDDVAATLMSLLDEDD